MHTFDTGFSKSTRTGIVIARGLFYGVVFGIVITVVVFALAFAAEIINCFTDGYLQRLIPGPAPGARKYLLHAGYGRAVGIFTLWDWRFFFDLAAFFVISTGPVGAVYSFALHKRARDEEKQNKKKKEHESI